MVTRPTGSIRYLRTQIFKWPTIGSHFWACANAKRHSKHARLLLFFAGRAWLANFKLRPPKRQDDEPGPLGPLPLAPAAAS